MTSTARYRSDPARIEGKVSLTDILIGMQRRIKINETAKRIGNTAIDGGNLIVREGDIIVSLSDDTEVLRIVHGDQPEIRWKATGVDGDRFGSIWAYDYTYTFGFGDIDTTEMVMGIYDGADEDAHVTDGGELVMSLDRAALEYKPNNADGDMNYYLNLYGRTDGFKGILNIVGRWDNSYTFNVDNAMVTGTIPVSAGFSGVTWNYSQASTTTPCPIIGLLDTAGLTTSWNVTAQSTTGFTVTWTGTLAHTVNFWNPRF